MYTVPIPQCMFSGSTRARIGEAIYLLGYLIQRSNWESGVTHVTNSAISEATGLPSRTIDRWMRVLREHGFISTRRTAFGTLVTIHNYEPVSRTHGVAYNPPPAAQRPADDPPQPAHQPAADGACDTPNMADGSAGDGASNIEEIPSPNHVNCSEKLSSLSIDRPDAPACGPREANGPDALAREVLEAMSAHERAELRMQTLEKMANSGKPYWTMFVRTDECGRLGTYDSAGEQAVTWHMVEAIKSGEYRARDECAA